MKKILIVYTGGTICSFCKENNRSTDIEAAKRIIVNNFEQSSSEFSDCTKDLFEDSKLEFCILSENMTIDKLNFIIDNIRVNDLSDFKGIIILHGTDTLAYTSSILSIFLQHINIPIMLVAANRPPNEEATNANVNFKTAVELIMKGITPNIYVPYMNSNKKMYLHLGATLMQCNNFSEDFYNASRDKCFEVDIEKQDYTKLFAKCEEYSSQRLSERMNHHNNIIDELQAYNDMLINNIKKIDDSILYIKPYVGLDYKKISLKGVKAIVHGTFHSGTVCVERNNNKETYSSKSILYLADRCRKKKIPIYISPCVLNSEQYSSTFDAVENGKVIPLNMTFESAYAKALLGVSCGYTKEELNNFVLTEINNEFVK